MPSSILLTWFCTPFNTFKQIVSINSLFYELFVLFLLAVTQNRMRYPLKTRHNNCPHNLRAKRYYIVDYC